MTAARAAGALAAVAALLAALAVVLPAPTPARGIALLAASVGVFRLAARFERGR